MAPESAILVAKIAAVDCTGLLGINSPLVLSTMELIAPQNTLQSTRKSLLTLVSWRHSNLENQITPVCSVSGWIEWNVGGFFCRMT
jgi:hypothetical protein